MVSCCWDNIRDDMTGLISTRKGERRMNPFHVGMDLLAEAQGATFFKVTTTNKFVYGFASQKDGQILLYLFNKTKEKQALEMKLSKSTVSKAQGKLMQDTADHWGELVNLAVKNSGQAFTIPSVSLC